MEGIGDLPVSGASEATPDSPQSRLLVTGKKLRGLQVTFDFIIVEFCTQGKAHVDEGKRHGSTK